jgi:hypothetical protein
MSDAPRWSSTDRSASPERKIQTDTGTNQRERLLDVLGHYRRHEEYATKWRIPEADAKALLCLMERLQETIGGAEPEDQTTLEITDQGAIQFCWHLSQPLLDLQTMTQVKPLFRVKLSEDESGSNSCPLGQICKRVASSVVVSDWILDLQEQELMFTCWFRRTLPTNRLRVWDIPVVEEKIKSQDWKQDMTIAETRVEAKFPSLVSYPTRYRQVSLALVSVARLAQEDEVMASFDAGHNPLSLELVDPLRLDKILVGLQPIRQLTSSQIQVLWSSVSSVQIVVQLDTARLKVIL